MLYRKLIQFGCGARVCCESEETKRDSIALVCLRISRGQHTYTCSEYPNGHRF